MISRLRDMRQRAADSAGYTLIELLVAMTVFTIFLAMLLTTVVILAQGATRAQVVSQSTAGVLVVFGQLDRQARYADSINYPGLGVGGAHYIEFRTPGSSSLSGVTTCTQWRFTPTTGKVESRTWNDLPGSTKSVWAIKLTSVLDDGGADYPFRLIPAGITAGSAAQQLEITIDAGSLHPDAGAAISTSFVARNSSIQSQSNADVDNNKVSDFPVCQFLGVRP